MANSSTRCFTTGFNGYSSGRLGTFLQDLLEVVFVHQPGVLDPVEIVKDELGLIVVEAGSVVVTRERPGARALRYNACDGTPNQV